LICIKQFQRHEGHAGSSRRCSAIPPTVLALADEGSNSEFYFAASADDRYWHQAAFAAAQINQSQRDQADIARPFTAAARRPSRRARLAQMILDPL